MGETNNIIEEKLSSLNDSSIWTFAKQDTSFENVFKATCIFDSITDMSTENVEQYFSTHSLPDGFKCNHRMLSSAQLFGLLTKNASTYSKEVVTPVFRELKNYPIGSKEFNSIKSEQLLKIKISAIIDRSDNVNGHQILPIFFIFDVLYKLHELGIESISMDQLYTYVMTCSHSNEVTKCVECLKQNPPSSPLTKTFASNCRMWTLITNNSKLFSVSNSRVSINPNYLEFFYTHFYMNNQNVINSILNSILDYPEAYKTALTTVQGLNIDLTEDSPKEYIERKQVKNDVKTMPLQQIFYGAPGTGKSHRVNEVTELQPEENVFRTTFHPDSDYSTFVGCYKPTKEPSLQKHPILDYDSLVDKLKEYLAIEPVNITRSCAQFGYDYHDSIVKMQESCGHSIPSLVADAYKSGTTYDSTVRAGMSIYESGAKTQNTSSTITYTFVPQAFTKAYIRAWQTEEPVYLVIEEINRGNCAQIFGDLFQLLDRKNGKSEYPIKPDTDLGNFIAEKLSSHVDGAPEKVVNGQLMILPKNLYIWATMNTSDQSLFPIDSAFKRRWDWKYIPINSRKEKWFIEAENSQYSWSAFLETINAIINEKTSSEDKQLGFYFCKAKNNIIDAETFVSKVVFYLWNDVFKDYGFDGEYFQDPDGGTLEFRKFFNFDGTINEKKVTAFMKNLKIETNGDNNNDAENQGGGIMKVTFPDNTIIEGATTVDVFMKTITKVVNEHGLDAVREADIKFSGLNIIQEVGWQNDKYPKSSQKQMDGYVLFLNAENKDKKSALEKLSERLELGLIVEFVS